MATTFHSDGSYSNTERVEDIELSNKNKTAQKAEDHPTATTPKRAARRAPRASANALDLNKLRSTTKKVESEQKSSAAEIEIAAVEKDSASEAEITKETKAPAVQPPLEEPAKETDSSAIEPVKETASTSHEEATVANEADEAVNPKLEVSGVIREIKLETPRVGEATESDVFDVVSLEALCDAAKTGITQLAPWARKCYNKCITSPDTVFGFGNSGLKLYSIRQLGPDIVLILGYENNIAAASYSFDTSSFTDKGSNLSFDGDVVCYGGKAVITTAYKMRPVRGV